MSQRANICGAMLVLVAASFVCNYLAVDSLIFALKHGPIPPLRYWYAPGSWACFAAGSQVLAAVFFVALVQPDRSEADL